MAVNYYTTVRENTPQCLINPNNPSSNPHKLYLPSFNISTYLSDAVALPNKRPDK